MTTTTDLGSILETLRTIAGYRGDLASWAYSLDAIDRWAPEGIRSAAKSLAQKAAAGEVDETFAFTLVCLACMGDDWAAKEVAGRFLSAVRRFRMVDAIRRHPRADRFASLVSALRSGKFTKAQFALAQKLAAEAA